MANGVYGNGLPAHLCGSYQSPDLVWKTEHDIDDQNATIGINPSRIWTECIGEGKIVAAAAYPETDHALRQVMMSGAAAIYQQIALMETFPEILLFTANKHIIRFFIMTAEDLGNSKWSISCQQVSDASLDLTNLMDCIQFRCLTMAVTEHQNHYYQHFSTLWSQITPNQTITTWWLLPKEKYRLGSGPSPSPSHPVIITLTPTLMTCLSSHQANILSPPWYHPQCRHLTLKVRTHIP